MIIIVDINKASMYNSICKIDKQKQQEERKVREMLYQAKNTNGTDGKVYYCNKNEIIDYMTVAEYKQLDYLEVVNAKTDKVRHRNITKKEL